MWHCVVLGYGTLILGQLPIDGGVVKRGLEDKILFLKTILVIAAMGFRKRVVFSHQNFATK